MEDEITELCTRLLQAKDVSEAENAGERLRAAIHEHILRIRRNMDNASEKMAA